MSSPDGWTVSEACAEFAAAGVPVDEDRFRMAVRVAGLAAAGRKPSPGPQGGRGATLYPIGELQRLHAALVPWLTMADALAEVIADPEHPATGDT